MNREFAQNGYTIFRKAITLQTIDALITEVDVLRREYSFRGGLRRLTELSESIADRISQLPLQAFLDSIDLPKAFLVRSILFDKTPDSNWKVAWHQDIKIPVKERVETKGFTAWSCKDGIAHTQPPARVLVRMRTLRIHLDDTPAENGALRVVPGSHASGILSASEIKALSANEKTCECEAGDILAISPLILHASSPSTSATHRRVIHLEFANQTLPLPLEWALS